MLKGLSGVQFAIGSGLVEYNSGSDRASDFNIDRARSARPISQPVSFPAFCQVTMELAVRKKFLKVINYFLLSFMALMFLISQTNCCVHTLPPSLISKASC